MRGRRVRAVGIVAIGCGLVVGLTPLPGGADPLGQVTEFSSSITPGARPDHIVAGPDGNMWFTESGTPGIGRITPDGATVTEFTTGLTQEPEVIVVGPDGNLWFTEGDGAAKVGRITPGAPNTITEFGPWTHTPEGITVGPDGKLWLAMHIHDGDGAIGRIDPSAVDPNTTITEFTAGLTPLANVVEITAGSDGNLWFTESIGNVNTGKIGRITPGAPNTITEFPLASFSNPEGITTGPDGNLWFVENFEGGTPRIGRMDPRAADPGATLAEFTTNLTDLSSPDGIVTGCDRNLWFTEEGRGGETPIPGQIGRITPAGVITEYPAPTGSFPAGIGASVPGDPNVWFGDQGHDRVDRIGLGACFTAAPTLVARFTG